MKICHVWDADYPWDVRVEKVSTALTKAGHEVHLVARNLKRREPIQCLPEGTLHRLPPLSSRRLNALSSFPAFFNPRWTGQIRSVTSEVQADVILVRDLPLAPAAVRVGSALGVPVALDMAENYPAMIRAVWESGKQRLLDWLVRNPRLVKAIENWTLPRLDHIFVVVEESYERIVRMGVDPDRVTVVSNTPPRSRLDQEPRVHNEDGPLRLFYLGLLEAPRGVDELIQAVATVRRRNRQVELDLVGDGRERESFEATARAAGVLGSAVRFRGYMPYSEALALMRKTDVGVVPHYANDSWNTTIPNKLFDYMAAGLPVLTSNVKPTARVVTEVRAGMVFRDRDIADMAEKIEALADGETRCRLGRAGRRAVAERFYWEEDATRLTASLEALVSSRTDPSAVTP